MHKDVFAVLARDKAKALRVIEPLHSTLFHFVRISWIWIALDESERPLAESCFYGRVLLTPGSVLTLKIV
jgi:hypothetical protein